MKIATMTTTAIQIHFSYAYQLFLLDCLSFVSCYHFEPAPPPPKLPPPNEPPMLPPPMPPKSPPPMIIPPPGPPKRLPRSERTRRRTVAPHDEQT